MTTLESLVIEWRDAREAILLVNWGDPTVAKAHIHLWERLGHAEAALMARARSYAGTVPDSDGVAEPARPRREWPEAGSMAEISTGIALRPDQGLTIDWSPPSPQPAQVIVHAVPRTEPALGRPNTTYCEDCPPVGYPTDATRCLDCPRRTSPPPTDGETS